MYACAICYILYSQVLMMIIIIAVVSSSSNEWVNKEKMCLYVMCVTSDIILVTTNLLLRYLNYILMLACLLQSVNAMQLSARLWKGYNKNTHHYHHIASPSSKAQKVYMANIIFIIYHQIASLSQFNRLLYCMLGLQRSCFGMCGNKAV